VNSLLPRISLPVVIAWLVMAALPAAAQSWIGAGPDDNWTTGANWSGGVPPASSPVTQVLFSAGNPRTTPVVDAPWTINQLNFGAGTYSFSGQTITFAGANATIGNSAGLLQVTISNPLTLAAPTTISGNNIFFTLSGPISGPGSLTVPNLGGVLLTGTSTFTGGLVITGAGVVALMGSIPGPVTVTSAGLFSGSGSVAGAVNVSGANAALDLGIAALSTGPLSVSAGSTLAVTINGAAPGQFGNVSVAGPVGLVGASLQLRGAYVPVARDVFTIISNDGTDPIVGTFAGLSEGATITFNGVPLRISYVGGTGNDVTLTSLAVNPDTHQVPTLSEWGFMILTMLVMAIGMLRGRGGKA